MPLSLHVYPELLNVYLLFHRPLASLGLWHWFSAQAAISYGVPKTIRVPELPIHRQYLWKLHPISDICVHFPRGFNVQPHGISCLSRPVTWLRSTFPNLPPTTYYKQCHQGNILRAPASPIAHRSPATSVLQGPVWAKKKAEPVSKHVDLGAGLSQ